MHHLAIMDAKRKLIDKILSGEKTIESRWYKSRIAPWNRISVGDIVYFKKSGGLVSARATVVRVVQYDHPTNNELRAIVDQYSGSPGICMSSSPDQAYQWALGRQYVLLIFLENPEALDPFPINKSGYGNACAWITVDNIDQLR